MRWSMILVLGVLACSGEGGPGGGGGGRGGGAEGGQDRKAEPVTVVELAGATRGGVSDLLVTSATVESEREADVMPQASGIVREIRVSEGDSVQRNQVLAVLENVSLDESAARAQAELRRLEADLAASERLFAQKALSQQELDQLKGQVYAARSTARETRFTEGNTRLVAPFEGVIGARDVRVGQLASSAARAFQVVDLTTLRVTASLPERDVARVRPGQHARLVSAYDDKLTAGATVDRVAPVIDAQTGTFRVILELDDAPHQLRPGQFVSVELEVDRHEDVVVVPKKAVVYEDGAPVIYRMVDAPPPEEGDKVAKEEPAAQGFSFSFGGGPPAAKDDKPSAPPSPFVAQRVQVDLGLIDETYAEIVDGIELGDKVVVIGQSNLKDGAPIKTPEMVAEDEAKAKAEADAKDAERGSDAASKSDAAGDAGEEG